MLNDRPTTVRLLGLAAGALAVFIVELALMRAVAQVTWPPFAFLALSAAMLGGGVAGTVLSVRPDWSRAAELAAAGGIVVAVGSPAAMMAVLLAGLEPLRVGHEVVATAVFVAVLLVLALPFVGLALSLSALLLLHPGHAHRVYAFDLLGAAAGSFLSVALLDVFGTPAAGSLAGALGAVSALLLARKMAMRTVAGATLVASLALLPAARSMLPRATEDKRVGDLPAAAVLAELRARGRLHTVDGADGRVDVVPATPAPALLIDLGSAVTRAPEFPLPVPPRDAASAGFLAHSPAGGDVLIVGSGAGYEVARALAFGAAHVDAVEVSSAVVTAATDGSIPASKALYEDSRVTLHLEEARSFLEQHDEHGSPRRWRHIIAVHTISNAAVTVNAMRLAEDFLLTRQSMRTLIRHLADDGVLYMTRPANQIELLADLARDALMSLGNENPDEHLALLIDNDDDPFFRGLLVSMPILSNGGRQALVAPRGFNWLPPPQSTGVALPTDERPFFHRRSADVSSSAQARLRIEGHGLAGGAIAWVGGLSMGLAAVVVVLPLVCRRRRLLPPQSAAARVQREEPPTMAHLAIAVLLGVGFMVLELSLAQRLTLLCGRPAVAFAAVIGGMLLGAGGVGLLVASRNLDVSLPAALVLSAAGCLVSVVVPDLLELFGVLALPSPVRAIVVALAAALCASPLGLGFPGLIEAAGARAPSSAPWLYGLNATVSVGAAALHAGLAPTLGLMGTSLLAAGCYAVAAVFAMKGRAALAPLGQA